MLGFVKNTTATPFQRESFLRNARMILCKYLADTRKVARAEWESRRNDGNDDEWVERGFRHFMSRRGFYGFGRGKTTDFDFYAVTADSTQSLYLEDDTTVSFLFSVDHELGPNGNPSFHYSICIGGDAKSSANGSGLTKLAGTTNTELAGTAEYDPIGWALDWAQHNQMMNQIELLLEKCQNNLKPDFGMADARAQIIVNNQTNNWRVDGWTMDPISGQVTDRNGRFVDLDKAKAGWDKEEADKVAEGKKLSIMNHRHCLQAFSASKGC